MSKQNTIKKFRPFRGTLDQAIDHSFYKRMEYTSMVVLGNYPIDQFRDVCFRRRFWAETFERLHSLKYTS